MKLLVTYKGKITKTNVWNWQYIRSASIFEGTKDAFLDKVSQWDVEFPAKLYYKIDQYYFAEVHYNSMDEFLKDFDFREIPDDLFFFIDYYLDSEFFPYHHSFFQRL